MPKDIRWNDFLLYLFQGEAFNNGFSASSITSFEAFTNLKETKDQLAVYTGSFPTTYSTPHSYDNSMTYTTEDIIAAGATGYSLSFSASTSTESGYDFFYVYSASTNSQLSKKSGSFGGTTLTVTSSTGIYFQLVTDVSQVYYGVDVTVTPVCSSGSFIDGTSNCCAAGSFK